MWAFDIIYFLEQTSLGQILLPIKSLVWRRNALYNLYKGTGIKKIVLQADAYFIWRCTPHKIKGFTVLGNWKFIADFFDGIPDVLCLCDNETENIAFKYFQ